MQQVRRNTIQTLSLTTLRTDANVRQQVVICENVQGELSFDW